MRLSLSRYVLVSVGFGLLGACEKPAPTTAEECAAMGSVKERDECYLVVAPRVFERDAAAGIALVEKEISDPLTRDMAWYNVTKEVDPHTNKYCDRMVDPTLAQRCRSIVSRPHLHRELTGKDAGGPGGAGGPPPGPGGPGGAPPGGAPGGAPPGGAPGGAPPGGATP